MVYELAVPHYQSVEHAVLRVPETVQDSLVEDEAEYEHSFVCQLREKTFRREQRKFTYMYIHTYPHTHNRSLDKQIIIHVLMRVEKEGRKKQARSNKQ